MVWRDRNKEIITANQNGMVTVWSAKDGTPTFVLQAHSSPITQLKWNEETQQLITCSKDKSIKFWQLPKVWRDEEEVIKLVKEEQ